MSEKMKVHTNRLINEKSPYLLQHAHNPVDWHPWSEEAFEKAKNEDKSVFLSIGYSTCHWCHVMEEESFSDEKIAEVLNKYFVSIKVDREERPDIDNVYMQAVLSITGSGGWPLTLFLAPDKKPFYGGTYFPPDDRWGRPGLVTTLIAIANTWERDRNKLLRSSDKLFEALERQSEPRAKEAIILGESALKKAFEHFRSNFDSQDGGFGSAPKFPMGHVLSFLLRYWRRTGEHEALEMAEKTLDGMAKGGMYDHIGGGFHRYSTDGQWRAPHFEKMLYDQAILSRAYIEAYQATGKKGYARTAREVFEYLIRDMENSEGAFYSAEDADSPVAGNPEKKMEGAFYLWSEDEIKRALGDEKAEAFNYQFGVKPDGNALQDPQGEFKGKNILYLAHSPEETASHLKKGLEEIKRVIADSKEILFSVRSKRPRPHLDDKILVDWNGLIISSLAFGSRVLNEPRYLKAAEKSARFILQYLRDKDGGLSHRYRQGESAIQGMIDDYAFFIHGLIDLYEASFNPQYLKEAKRLAYKMLSLFWDEKSWGFFFTPEGGEIVLIRQKEAYDGAIPSGNSVAALALIRLGKLTIDSEFDSKAQALFKAFSRELSKYPNAYPQMLIALDFALGPSKEVVIAGDKLAEETNLMLEIIYQRFIPNKVVAFRPSSQEEARGIISLAPYLEVQLPQGGKTTAYICENYICKLPATNVKKLKELLE